MNDKNIVVFDFETAGDIVQKNGTLDASRVVPIQIACVVLDPRKLKVIPGSEFESIMRPPEGTKLNAKALEINKKTEAEIWNAPGDWEAVWVRFCNHVRKYNPRGASPFTAPIPAGKNIRNFDMPIAQWLCEKFNQVDKSGTQNIYSNRQSLDLEDNIFAWFEDNQELENYKMDTLREYFGLSTEGAHDAMVDVLQTAYLLRKFHHLHRDLFPRIKFKGSAAGAVLK